MTPTQPSTLTLRPIGPVDLEAERRAVGPALGAAIERALASGQYVLGPEVERFERDFAAFQGVSHAVGVASGTDALALALVALGVERGSRVVTSPFTFFASAGAIAWIGALPLFADVDLETALLEPAAAEAAVDRDTSALLPVHLYGQLADVQGFRALADRRKLALVEDGAQAHGASRDGFTCGQLGHAAAFSFYPTKNLGAAGDAGAVLTQSGDVAARLRRLRDHGSPAKYVHDEVGTNSRLAALQAAVLNAKLPWLTRWNERRAQIAAAYDRLLAGEPCLHPIQIAPGARSTYHQYTVRVSGGAPRDRVVAGLRERGIAAGVHYPTPVHLQRAAARWAPPGGWRPGQFPNAERLAREVLCLPVHPFLTDAEVERVAKALLELARTRA
jgi:dTDP-4-amino-4,6-dideoxygalactose transaminase